MHHGTLATVGKRLFVTYPLSYRSRLKHSREEIPNPRDQTPNKGSKPKIQNAKQGRSRDIFGFEFWVLGFPWDLEPGIWDFCLPMIRVVLPHHLRTLAKVGDEVHVDLNGSATVKAVLDALENKHPMLRGTIREHNTLKRRPLVRFFACGEDISHQSPDAPLPDAIVKGTEPFFVMGAIAGG